MDKQAILDAVLCHLERQENRIPWLYKDTASLITAGVGHVVKGLHEALTFSWRVDDRPATPEEIGVDFAAIARAPGGKSAAFYAPLTRMRLGSTEITSLA